MNQDVCIINVAQEDLRLHGFLIRYVCIVKDYLTGLLQGEGLMRVVLVRDTVRKVQ